jgi:hypothetical protein
MIDAIWVIFGVILALMLLIGAIGWIVIMFKVMNWFFDKWVLENKSIDTIITDEVKRRSNQ